MAYDHKLTAAAYHLSQNEAAVLDLLLSIYPEAAPIDCTTAAANLSKRGMIEQSAPRADDDTEVRYVITKRGADAYARMNGRFPIYRAV